MINQNLGNQSMRDQNKRAASSHLQRVVKPARCRLLKMAGARIATLSIGSIIALHAPLVVAAEPSTASTQQITRAGTQASAVGPAANFTGQVRVDMVWPSDDGINTSGALVTFEPGARSAWHSHPAGQRLVLVSGLGLTQEWGKPIQEIRPGDVVWCPPGVKHWHGASPKTAMVHLAVTATASGKNVEWMEKVSDEQYNKR